MMKFFIFFLLVVFIMLVMVLVNYLLFTISGDKWGSGSLEAGFITTGVVHKSYSLQFFLLMIIFIVFDLEVLFIFNFVTKMNSVLLVNFLIIVFFLFTLFLEWKWSKLVWLN